MNTPGYQEAVHRIESLNSNTSLDISELGLTICPPLPAGLKELNCSNNYLEELPELPASLTHLFCGYNALFELPELPASLIELSCPHNLLDKLPELPASLEFIDCKHNVFTEHFRDFIETYEHTGEDIDRLRDSIHDYYHPPQLNLYGLFSGLLNNENGVNNQPNNANNQPNNANNQPNNAGDPLATRAKPANAPAKCFDPISHNATTNVETEDVATFYILGADNKVVSAGCLDESSLEQYKTGNQFLFYRCKETVPVSAALINPNSVYPEKYRLFNFEIRTYIKASDARQIKVGSAYVLKPEEPIGRIASHSVVHGGSLVSANHCGPADGSMLYSVHLIVHTGGKRCRRARRTRRRQMSKHRKAKKTRGRK
jgi:hypothetical protein